MRVVRALSALLVVAAAAPAARADASPQLVVWEAVRTSSVASQLAISMSAGFANSRTVLAVTYLRSGPSGPVVLPGAHLSSSEGTSFPKAYADGERVQCPTAAPCALTRGTNVTTVYYNDSGRSDPLAPDRVLVVTYGRQPTATLANGAKQWRLRRISRPVRFVWSSDSDTAVGAWHESAGVEVFTSASAPGGRRGSVAIGVPPCSGTPIAAAAGAGSATLEGGVKPVSTSCPTDVLRPSQIARRATTWTFRGQVAGVMSYFVHEPGTVRLLVIDL